MRKQGRPAALFLVWTLGGALSAAAQQGSLSNLIPNLFDQTIVLAQTGHQAHFIDSSGVLRDAGLQINSSIVGQISSFPISSSAGGFTFTFDPSLGVFSRSTDSYGPLFAERPETSGKGKWNVGVSYLRYRYDTMDGLDLDDGTLAFSLTHLDTNRDGGTVETVFEGDVIEANAFLDLTSDVTLFSLNWGVTDRLDVSVVVPVVRVELDAQVSTTINRQATEGLSDPPLHRFPDGSSSRDFNASGSASGVGDALVRAKYRLFENASSGLAVGLDARLPTGAEEDLLGTGSTLIELSVIGATRFGRFAPHVNAGYTVATGGGDGVEVPDEVNFTVGFDAALHPRVTLAADVIWRTLRGALRVERQEVPFLYRRHDSPVVHTTSRPLLATETGDVNVAYGALGVKVNLYGKSLLLANLLYSLSDQGLQDRDAVALLGIDYSF